MFDTLERLAREGVDPEQVDAVIHRLEFEKRERSNVGFPYALKVLFSCLPSYNYGGDTYSALNFDSDLERLEAERKNGHWFEDLIRAELLDNQHRSLLVVSPDSELEERQRARELGRLGAEEASLSDQDRQRIVADALRLKADQDAKQDLSVLPTLGLDDIPMKFDPIASESLAAAAEALAARDRDLARIHQIHGTPPMWSRRPGFLNTTSLSSRIFRIHRRQTLSFPIARRVAADTGGIGAAAQVQSLAAVEDFVQSFIVSGKALDRKLVPFVELLTDLIARLEIDPPRLKEIIAETATRLESSLANLGLQFAILLAQAKLTSEGALNDRLQGIRMLHVMRDLAKLGEDELGDVIAKLQTIRTTLFTQGALRIVVTCEESTVPQVRELLTKLVSALPQGDVDGNAAPKPEPLDPIPEARTAPVPVAFNVRTFKTIRYTHPDAPALLVLANYLRDTFLHRELREKGGAYGGFAQASTGAGFFYLGSYRDPNVVRTYEVYDRAARWAIDSPIEPEALKEAILGACGDVDPLESPDIKGRREAVNRLTGFTLQERERFKQRLLQVTANDLTRVSSSYLAGGRGVQATVAGAELIAAAQKEHPGLFEVVAPV